MNKRKCGQTMGRTPGKQRKKVLVGRNKRENRGNSERGDATDELSPSY